jgi:pimeloyl-ACP methyl ester carboxylesterase
MPAVFVHGVPETPAVWDPLRSHLGRDDAVALQLPGFGCARPQGFEATKEEYVAWLIRELDQLQARGPVDLVGHDWGGGLVVRLVSVRPDLVRSWVTDAATFGDADHDWHDFAKLWQTPDEGEAFMSQTLAQPIQERSALLEASGVPSDAAEATAREFDSTMAECILALYRSAVSVGKEWSPDFRDIRAPGLVLVSTEDAFTSPEGNRVAARQAGAGVVELSGLGHWWMLQDPANGAAVLEEFWSPDR